MLTVTNPDSGSATEELEVEYDSDPIDIGFNSRYLLDIAAQIEGEVAVLKLADPGSPTLIQDKDSRQRALRAHADAGLASVLAVLVRGAPAAALPCRPAGFHIARNCASSPGHSREPAAANPVTRRRPELHLLDLLLQAVDRIA